MPYGIPLYPSAITEPYLFNKVAEVLIDSSWDNWFAAKTLNCEMIVNNDCEFDIIKIHSNCVSNASNKVNEANVIVILRCRLQ